jgi:hypothetical protein
MALTVEDGNAAANNTAGGHHPSASSSSALNVAGALSALSSASSTM